MSVHALPEKWPPQMAAEELEDDFRQFATRVPIEATYLPVDEPYKLVSLDGVGALHAAYRGCRRGNKPDSDHRFIALILSVTGYEVSLNKEYEQCYGSRDGNAVLVETSNISPEDLVDAPIPLDELLFAARALRAAYMNEQPTLASVTSIEDYRRD